MPNTMRKNLHLCFTKIKRPQEPGSISAKISSDDLSHPFLIKNYNSLCDYHFDSASKSLAPSSSSMSASSSTPSDGDEPEFAAVFASHRFFFSSPGRSNSIIDSTPATSSKSSTDASINDNAAAPNSESSETTSTNLSSLVDSCESQFPESHNSRHQTVIKDSGTMAVPTYSPDPYLDFRRSMQEMVEARNLLDVKANWDYLHELLLCYLALNPKSTHKFIVRAFADLLVSLLSLEPEDAGHRESGSEMSRQPM